MNLRDDYSDPYRKKLRIHTGKADIAKRLRRWWASGAQIWQRDATSGGLLLEAADEIDRLRGEAR